MSKFFRISAYILPLLLVGLFFISGDTKANIDALVANIKI